MMLKKSKIYYMLKGNEKFISGITIVGKAEEGWSCPDIVEIQYKGNTLIGFLKRTVQQGNKNIIEMLLNYIGNELDVKIADTVGVYSDNSYSNLIAIISISAVSKLSEKFICFREMRDYLFYDYKSGAIQSNDWLKRWISIRERKHYLPAEIWEVHAICRQDYIDCIMFAFEILRLYIEKQKLSLKDFERDYIKMILFDILIGQADRSASNYGIVVDTNTRYACLASLFDNSTLTKPYIQNDMISFNHILLERKQAAEVVFDLFNDSTIAFRNKLNEKSDNILEVLNTIIPCYDTKTIDFLIDKIKEGIKIIETL